MSRFRELELERHRGDLNDLVRNHGTVTDQLRVEGDGSRQNQLRDQLERIGQEMEWIEHEINRLEREVQQEETDVNALVHILQQHESQFQEILITYQRVLANWRCQVNPNPKTPQEIVTELLRIPKGQAQQYNALTQFVGSLIRRIDNADVVYALQAWGEQHITQWEGLLEWLEHLQEQQNQNAQPALLIAVSRSDEASTQSQGGDRYQLKAWLIRDISHYKKHKQGYTFLEGTGVAGDEIYSEEELHEKAPQLMLQFLAECTHTYDNDPEIHIFLPLALINQAVDCWTLDNGYGRSERLGHKYKVIIRCLDRLGRSYRHRPRWVRKWQRQQSLLQERASNVFIACDDTDLDDLFERLEELEDAEENNGNADIAIIGLKMTKAPYQVGPDSLFGAFLQFGFPLAIWGRCNLSTIPTEAELDRILQACCLEKLPGSVKQERRKCRRQPEDGHIGHHLALIWDDPELVPPKSA